MKALILAAGLGSRLKQKTVGLPKALLPVGGKPILKRQIESLVVAGIRKIVLVIGHEGQKIVDFIANTFQGLEVQYVVNPDASTTNSSYSFWLARRWIEGEPYLHLNCDILFSPALLRQLIDSPRENLIAVRTDCPLGDRMENVALNGDQIVEMSITKRPRSEGKAFGLAKLGPRSTGWIARRIESLLAQGDRKQHLFGVIREALKELNYFALKADGELLLEVNTLEDLRAAEEVLATYRLT